MAESDQDKTEEPTAKRRQDSRREGQVAYSSDLAGSVLMLIGALALWMGGGFVGQQLKAALRHYFTNTIYVLDASSASLFLNGVLFRVLQLGGVLIVVFFVASLGVGVAQAGVFFSFEALAFKGNKLNPISGMQKIFSSQGVMKAVFQILKVAAVAAVLFFVLSGDTNRILAMGQSTLAESVQETWDIAIKVFLIVAIVLAALGVGDFVFQKYKFEESLKMTKQEVKDEQKQSEGDPQVKGKLRAIQRELATRQRMMEDVPEATVVITNPTHIAVALKYDKVTAPTPIVLAKGQGFVAKRIAEIARDHSIPVVERKPVARALFSEIEVGDEIPVALYYAVSEVLAYVYRMRGIV